jgi:hypothetical protein
MVSCISRTKERNPSSNSKTFFAGVSSTFAGHSSIFRTANALSSLSRAQALNMPQWVDFGKRTPTGDQIDQRAQIL